MGVVVVALAICFLLFNLLSIMWLTSSQSNYLITFCNHDENDIHASRLPWPVYDFDSLPFRKQNPQSLKTQTGPKFRVSDAIQNISILVGPEGINGNGCRGVAGARVCEAVSERGLWRLVAGDCVRGRFAPSEKREDRERRERHGLSIYLSVRGCLDPVHGFAWL
jgi:hypothetical protein